MDPKPLKKPWLVAVWPGMGNVAFNAGVYLLSQLQMNELHELRCDELYDVDGVTVEQGLIQRPRHPRNRFFSWSDPKGERDLIVFLGEAQPPLGKFSLCQRLLTFAVEHNVERVFAFAAMATQMHPEHRSRLFGAATDERGVTELRRLEVELLEEGQISGLNGILLGAAIESGIRGTCLLGEMPHIFHQLPFPKASLGILEGFTTLAGIELDLKPLERQAQQVDHELGSLLKKIEERLGKARPGQSESEDGAEFETAVPEPEQEERVAPSDRRQIETLFDDAAQTRSKAFELKQLLDRLGVFKEYEDRFLDLFKKPS